MSHSRVHVATWPHQCTVTFNPCKLSSKSRARPSALRESYSLSPSLSLLLLALKRGVESRLDYSHINMFAFHRFSGRPTRHVRDFLVQTRKSLPTWTILRCSKRQTSLQICVDTFSSHMGNQIF